MLAKAAEWFGLNKALGSVIVGLVVLAVIALLVFGGYQWGSDACEAGHNKAQLESDINRAKGDDKIEKNIPINGGRRVKLDWLRQHTVGN